MRVSELVAEEDALARLTGDESCQLLLAGPERPENRSELLDFPPVRRPVSRALGGDGAIVMRLRLSQQLTDSR